MPVAPRDAGVSQPDAASVDDRRRLPPARRLRSPAQFAAVTSDPKALRAGRGWLSMACRVQPGSTTTPVRFGFTVARRLARRAVDRNTIKRTLREAARQHVAMLDAVAASRSVDIVLRLKRPVGEAGPMSRASWKATLRGEADWLLRQLAARLRAAEAS